MAPTERWVNAVCEIVVPLEVSPDASPEEKLKAAEDHFQVVLDEFGADEVIVIRWEDAHA